MCGCSLFKCGTNIPNLLFKLGASGWTLEAVATFSGPTSSRERNPPPPLFYPSRKTFKEGRRVERGRDRDAAAAPISRVISK